MAVGASEALTLAMGASLARLRGDFVGTLRIHFTGSGAGDLIFGDDQVLGSSGSGVDGNDTVIGGNGNDWCVNAGCDN